MDYRLITRGTTTVNDQLIPYPGVGSVLITQRDQRVNIGPGGARVDGFPGQEFMVWRSDANWTPPSSWSQAIDWVTPKPLVIQHCSAKDSEIAQGLKSVLGGEIINVCHPGDLPLWEKMVIVGAQESNVDVWDYLRDHGLKDVTPADEGHVYVQRVDVGIKPAWAVAGYTWQDTVDSAKWVKINGLPTKTVRLTQAEAFPPETTEEEVLHDIYNMDIADWNGNVSLLVNKYGMTEQEAEHAIKDVFGVVAPLDMWDIYDLLIIGGLVGSVVRLGAAAASRLASRMLGRTVTETAVSAAGKASFRALIEKVIANPKSMARPVAAMEKEMQKAIMKELASTIAGKAAMKAMISELATSRLAVLGVQPKTLALAVAGLYGAVTTLFGFTYANEWFAKEGLNEVMQLSIWAQLDMSPETISDEDLRKLLNETIPYARQQNEKARALINSVAPLWPPSTEFWLSYPDTVDKQLDGYVEIINRMLAAPKATITIETKPAGAKVWYDGALWPYPTATTIEGLEEKEYEIRVTKDRYVEVTQKVKASVDNPPTVSLTLQSTEEAEEAEGTSPPKEKARLVLDLGLPGVEVIRGTELLGVTDETGKLSVEVDPFSGDLTLRKDGYVDAVRYVIAKGGETTDIPVVMEEVTEKRKLYRVTVLSSPDGAKVLINNTLLTKDGYTQYTPCQVLLAPGTYAFEITKAGYEAWTETVTLEEIA